MILSPDHIKHRLKQLGVGADKWLGQHFLVDEEVLEIIMAKTREVVGSSDTIVEVGPGLGVLTDALVALQQPVVAIERDPVLYDNLARFLNHPSNLMVVQGDVLDVITPEYEPAKSWVVIANIPYGITSPLLRKLLSAVNPPHDIVVLVQKEAAERIVAKPGDAQRGLLTVEIETFVEAEIIHVVPPTAFWPEPEVDSAVLWLRKRPHPIIAPSEWAHVRRTVIAGFSSKRKQLQNSLAGGLGVSSGDARELLQRADIAPMRRAETLTLEEWWKLSQQIK